MTESFSSYAEQAGETVQEKLYGVMGRIAEKYPRARQFIAGLGTMLAVFSAGELNEPTVKAPEKEGTIEDILNKASDPETKERIKFIVDKYQDFSTILPEYAGEVTYKHNNLYANFEGVNCFPESKSGILPEADSNVIFSHGGCMAIFETSKTNNRTVLFDSRADNTKLAKPKGGRIEATGPAYTIQGSACTNWRDALMKALKEAACRQEGIDITSDKSRQFESAGKSGSSDFKNFISTNESACLVSYRIKDRHEEKQELRDMRGEPIIITEYVIELEVVPGKFVPGTEEKSLSPEYNLADIHE